MRNHYQPRDEALDPAYTEQVTRAWFQLDDDSRNVLWLIHVQGDEYGVRSPDYAARWLGKTIEEVERLESSARRELQRLVASEALGAATVHELDARRSPSTLRSFADR